MVDVGMPDIDIESYHSSQKSAKKRRTGNRDRDSDAFKGERSHKSSELEVELEKLGTDFDDNSSKKNHSDHEAYLGGKPKLRSPASR